MYKDTNSVVFGGRLTADPETKKIGSEECVKFRMAINNGVEEGPNFNTLYMDFEWWSPNKAVQYLSKGKKVEITGKMYMSHWTDKNDSTKRSRPYVKVLSLELKGSKKQEFNEQEDSSSDFISSLNSTPF